MSRSRGAATSATLGAALAALAFLAGGASQVGASATLGVVVVLLAGAAFALSVLRGWPERLDGVASLALLAATAVLTALSVSWSVAPGESVEEAARTFTYLAVFALAVLAAHVRPRAAGVVLAGVLLAGVAVCGWALITRVFPGQLAELVLGARLGVPFGYWNALGGMAVLTLPGAMWLGTRRGGHVLLTALAYPAAGALLLTLLLTQSRGALGAGVLVLLLWLAAVPRRLRSLAVMGIAAVVVAPVAAWSLSRDAFSAQLQPLSAREEVAGDFGLLLLGMLVLLAGAGLAVEAGRRRGPSLATRTRAGAAVAGVAGLLALAALAAVALSDRGLPGAVSDRVKQVASEEAAPPRGAARLGSVSSSRAGYWREAREVFEEAPLIGRGANAFGTARLVYRRDGRAADQAHGYLAQTLADLGLVGGTIALALLAAWLAAAARASGLWLRRGPGPPAGAERSALIGLALTAVGYGAQSAIDWTWFFPGPTAAALVAAGFVAGRGRPDPIGAPPSTAPAPAGLSGLSALARAAPGRLVGAAAVLVTAGLCAWAVWQPERAADASQRVSELLDEGDTRAAARQARRAREIDPYSPEPLYAQAVVLTRSGSLALAYRTYELAVAEHPRDTETWLRLAGFELELDLPGRALETLQGAARVDPHSPRIPALAAAAQAELAPPPAAPEPPPAAPAPPPAAPAPPPAAP